MVEPYKAKKIPDHWKTAPKKDVEGKIVAISGLRLEKRGTWLMHPRTRSLRRCDIAELTVTDQEDAEPGGKVNSVLYIGFLEIEDGGVLVSGDSVYINGKKIGTVAGFSDIHCPNHLNIMVKALDEYSKKNIHPYSDASIAGLDYKIRDQVIFSNNK